MFEYWKITFECKSYKGFYYIPRVKTPKPLSVTMIALITWRCQYLVGNFNRYVSITFTFRASHSQYLLLQRVFAKHAMSLLYLILLIYNCIKLKLYFALSRDLWRLYFKCGQKIWLTISAGTCTQWIKPGVAYLMSRFSENKAYL